MSKQTAESYEYLIEQMVLGRIPAVYVDESRRLVGDQCDERGNLISLTLKPLYQKRLFTSSHNPEIGSVQ
jgi:hypothetical protein